MLVSGDRVGWSDDPPSANGFEAGGPNGNDFATRTPVEGGVWIEGGGFSQGFLIPYCYDKCNNRDFFSSFWEDVGRPLAAIAVAIYVPQLLTEYIVSGGAGVLTTVTSVTSSGVTIGLSSTGTALVGFVGGFATGAVNTGTLDGALQGGLSGGLFAAASLVGGADSVGRLVAHGAAGCVSAVAGGGDCGTGALSAVVGKATTNFVNANFETAGPIAKGVATIVAGGVASVAGGGKFENGAVTAAFGYLYNACGGGKCALIGAATGTGLGVAGAAACDVVSGGACLPANAAIVAGAAATGAAIGGAMDWAEDLKVHGNSSNSMRGTELYYLVNNTSGEIDKIGITSNPGSRYSQAYLTTENVTYVPQTQYTWRYAAQVDENIRLTFYRFENGQLPRLNKVTR